MAVLIRSVSLLFLSFMLAGCRSGPEQWGPFRGQVVDEDSGMPIAGANVMVLWIREPPNFHFTQWFYDAQETVTDESGRFELRRQTRLLTAFVNEPGVGVFVPGYLMLAPEVTPRSNGRRYVDPTVIRMRPLKTREEQCKYEPRGITGDAHTHVPRFVKAQYDYQVALRCGQLR